MSVSIVENAYGLDFIGSSSKDEQYRFFSIEAIATSNEDLQNGN